MKTKYHFVRLILATALLSLLAPFAHAGPGPQYWTTLRHQSEFVQLQTGDNVAFVCKGCQTISEFTITGPDQAAALSKEGAAVSCPACKAVTKVVLKRQRNDPPAQTIVTYVNDQGVECAFLAKVPASHEN